MKSQIFFFLFCACILGQVNIINAQSEAPTMSEEQKANFKSKMQNFAQELDLTAEQQPAFTEIHKNYFSELRGLKESDMAKFSKYQKYKSIQSDKQKSVKKLLTKDQYKKYKKGWNEFEKAMKANAKA